LTGRNAAGPICLPFDPDTAVLVVSVVDDAHGATSVLPREAKRLGVDAVVSIPTSILREASRFPLGLVDLLLIADLSMRAQRDGKTPDSATLVREYQGWSWKESGAEKRWPGGVLDKTFISPWMS